ncbi:hypothetical protein [Actinomadura sp. 6N118]|uniref:hypothetical protein n=1 Tax=Actinomadura sp. 6N118 TaxID=3375151 RepID=UPI003787917E
MTIAPERVTTDRKKGRHLVTPELFEKLSAYVEKHQSVTRPYAESVIEQTLVWLNACAENPTVRLGMSDSVDPGWHAFILHSQEYTAFCQEQFGRYFHHVPPAPGNVMDAETIARTLPVMYASGYEVEESFWTGALYPCCPPNPCVAAAENDEEDVS